MRRISKKLALLVTAFAAVNSAFMTPCDGTAAAGPVRVLDVTPLGVVADAVDAPRVGIGREDELYVVSRFFRAGNAAIYFGVGGEVMQPVRTGQLRSPSAPNGSGDFAFLETQPNGAETLWVAGNSVGVPGEARMTTSTFALALSDFALNDAGIAVGPVKTTAGRVLSAVDQTPPVTVATGVSFGTPVAGQGPWVYGMQNLPGGLQGLYGVRFDRYELLQTLSGRSMTVTGGNASGIAFGTLSTPGEPIVGVAASRTAIVSYDLEGVRLTNGGFFSNTHLDSLVFVGNSVATGNLEIHWQRGDAPPLSIFAEGGDIREMKVGNVAFDDRGRPYVGIAFRSQGLWKQGVLQIPEPNSFELFALGLLVLAAIALARLG